MLPSGGVLHVDGPEEGDPVLFLHGAGGGAWSWKPQRYALSSRWRLFIWEARGHGAAARVGDAGVADYYADAREGLAAVIDATRRPAFVVGHSLGGLLALALACDAAAGVHGLALIDPFYPVGRYDRFAGARSFARMLCAPLLRSCETNGPLGRKFVRWLFEHAFENRERMEAAWADQRAQIPFEYGRVLREGFDGPAGFPLRAFGSEVSEPTLLVNCAGAGAAARIGPLAADLAGRLGPHFHHETIAGGHYLQLDRPDAVTSALRTFLTTYGSAER